MAGLPEFRVFPKMVRGRPRALLSPEPPSDEGGCRDAPVVPRGPGPGRVWRARGLLVEDQPDRQLGCLAGRETLRLRRVPERGTSGNAGRGGTQLGPDPEGRRRDEGRSMTLAAGVRLGLYEILAPLGAGRMGEVYAPKGLRLGRDVAIKVLLASFSADADRLRR